ncbi:MAG: GNAT family N-acetyltransferase [Ignavibacteriales bacterium]|nr:GNAT family N-acetyltransferase [Ignavibacteriales bacterium]
MIERMQIRPARSDEYQEVSDLVLRVFDLDVAPLYIAEGIEVFHSYSQAAAMRERAGAGHTILVAELEGRLVGAAEVRDFNHLSLLFVERQSQRNGIGRMLLLEVLRLCRAHISSLKAMTVNSSPNAVEAYKRLGFRATSGLQRKDGIDFVSMEIKI